MMNNELLERVTFKDVFETKEIFASGWTNSGYSGITSTNVNIIYNLLYARYCNSTVASIDIDRFKSQVYAIMYMHGPAWQKKQAIQDYIYALQEDDIRIGSTTVLNTAQNPSTAPATDAFEALTKIDSQNASRTISSPIKAYAELRTLVEDGFTETFIDKFKKLFIVVLDTNCNLPPILRVRGNHIYTGDTLPDIGYPYWDGDLFVKTNGEIYQYNTTEWTFILSMAGELTPEILLEKIEGSDYISVDLNETDDKVKIELDETKLDTEVTEDSDNLITSGAVFDGLSEKQDKLSDAQVSNINRALVSPVSSPSEKLLVGVDTDRGQIMYKLGDNLSIDGTTSPFTINASGGSGDSKLVEVTYGVTTASEIQAILDSGKIPYVIYNNRWYDFKYKNNSGTYVFSSDYLLNNIVYHFQIFLNNNQWFSNNINDVTYEKVTNKKNTITPTSTTEYPTSKAVADYVAQHSGGGWQLLWENASPTSQFASQTLTLDTTNYSKLAITLYQSATIIIDKSNTKSRLTDYEYDDGDSIAYHRAITTINNSQIVFNNCRGTTITDGGEISSSNKNNACKPYKIYGFN